MPEANRLRFGMLLGVMLLLWAGSLGVVAFGAAARPHGTDLHVSGYLSCGSSPSPTRVTAAPTVRVDLAGNTTTVDLTLSLESTADHCQVNFMPIDQRQTARLDGRTVAVPERGPWAVVVPTDGREHDVHLHWSGRRAATSEAVGRSVFTVSTYLSFPPGRGEVLGTGRLDDTDGPLLQVRVPDGHRPDAISGGVRRGREVAVAVGVSGLDTGSYRIAYDRGTTRWVGIGAPYVLTATSTLLLLLAAAAIRTRRRAATSG